MRCIIGHMFVDEATITVSAGKGGNGAVTFFAGKHGPSGGNGGKGGDVYAVYSPYRTTLSTYLQKTKYEAEDGVAGGSNRRFGLDGADLELPFPHGTYLTDLDTKETIEIGRENPRVLICRGGNGGLGNDMFKTATNRTPRHAEPGARGKTRRLRVVLKLIADFGFIGFPNAGKSSLLNELTAANARVASYPFTTLEPNLGVVNGKVIADIPGLIEGASQGKGLGIKFLKHVEKVGLLVHCISSESADPVADYKTVRQELVSYSNAFEGKKELVLLTKVDLLPVAERTQKLKLLEKNGINAVPVSLFDADALAKLTTLLI